MRRRHYKLVLESSSCYFQCDITSISSPKINSLFSAVRSLSSFAPQFSLFTSYSTSLCSQNFTFTSFILTKRLHEGNSISHLMYLSQNAKRASARKDTGLDQSLFSVQLFRLRINIIKLCKGANKGHLGGLDKVFKIRDHHHRIHRQILRPNEGLILILAQS